MRAFTVDRGEVRGPVAMPRTALSARSSSRMAGRVARFVAQHPVDVAHVHNFFPLPTPAVHETLFMLSIPIVQTLHNYRLVCAHGGFLRDIAIARSASCAHPGTRCALLGVEARAHFEDTLAPERRTGVLLGVYRSVLSTAG